ncbi:MAG TPA: RNA methyltransferase [Burkholderiales bacterium]|jgi:TrmH family RNA methyltransferase
MSVLTSKDNPKVQHWRKLAEDARYRRAEKRALIEGPHLLEAALQHGCKPIAVLATPEAKVAASLKPVLLSEGVFRSIVDAETPQGVAAEIAIPERKPGSTLRVFLEGIQDPRNVGAIVRTAAAFGVGRVVLDKACADPWSPKALRAGMGGHFAVSIKVKSDLGEQLNAFKGHLLCTVPRDGMPIEEADLSGKVGWIFGGEGRGLSEETLRQVPLRVTIPMAAGTESLNVAAAAAICLYETFSRSAA